LLWLQAPAGLAAVHKTWRGQIDSVEA
jgi:hypothetical protein